MAVVITKGGLQSRPSGKEAGRNIINKAVADARNKTISGGGGSSSQQQINEIAQESVKEPEATPINERQLRSLNLQARQQYQKQVASGTDRKVALEKLRTELSRNRLNYQIQRIESGRIGGYKTPQIEVKRNESGQIQIIERKTGNVYDKNLQYVDKQTDEVKTINLQEKVLIASTEPAPSKFTRFVKEKYYTAKNLIAETNQANSRTLQNLGVTDENLKKSSDILSSFSLLPKKAQSGFIQGVAKEVRDKPFTNVALLSVGAIGGAVTEGVPLLIRGSAGVLGFTKTAPVIGNVVKTGTTLTGLGLTTAYALSEGKRIYKIPGIEDKSAEFGSVLFQGSVIGKGFNAGVKGSQNVAGIVSTKERKYIDIPQGEYPTAPTRKQLSLFRKNIYPELSNKPGAFHTTSTIFWQKGTIQPAVGTSELPGLYASTKISTPFSRIVGSSKYNKPAGFNLKQMFTLNQPGVAYLTPEGFRYSSFTKSPKGSETPYKFVKSAKQGFMDLPLMKTEIEAIARPDAGNYVQTNNKFYTEIKGTRVPIDVFNFNRLPSASDKTLQSSRGYNAVVTESYKPQSLAVSPVSQTEILQSDVQMLSSNIDGSTISPILGQSSTKTASNFYSVESELTKGSSSSSGTTSSPFFSSSSISSNSLSSSIPSSSSPPTSRVRSFISSLSRSSSQPPSSNTSSWRSSSSIPPSSPPRLRPPSSTISKVRNLLNSSGYKTFIVRKGKKIFLPGVFGRGEAIQRGEKNILSNLGATFGVEKTNIQVFDSMRDYKPRSDVFRDFLIRGEKKIGLKDTWIQKAGTQKEGFTRKGGRLASVGERKEIKMFRKQKARRFKWY